MATDPKMQDRTQPVLPMAPGAADRRTHDDARHGMTKLFAALDVANRGGDREMRHVPPRHLAFLKEIVVAVPVGLDVHLVVNSCATHKTEGVRKRIARRRH